MSASVTNPVQPTGKGTRIAELKAISRNGTGVDSIDLESCKRRGIAVRGAKSGPDYIDPGFHAAATGRDDDDAKGGSEHPALAAHAAGEIACTIIRPGDVYGPGSRPWVLSTVTRSGGRSRSA